MLPALGFPHSGLEDRVSKELCGSAELRGRSEGLGPCPCPALPVQRGPGQTLGPWASGFPYNKGKMSPRALPALIVSGSLFNLKYSLRQEQGRLSLRLGAWSVEMLREAEGQRNKGQAKLWDSDCLRILGVALMNDIMCLPAPAPLPARRSCPALG